VSFFSFSSSGMKIYMQHLLLLIMYFFNNETDENLAQLALKRPFKLQRMSTSDTLCNGVTNITLGSKNLTKISK
jgi:hypothetical protein